MFRFVLAVATLLLLFAYANAQGPPPRIGVILQGGPWYAVLDGVRVGLKRRGLEEGRDFIFDVRDTRGDLRTAEQAASAFESERVALILTAATSVTAAAQKGAHSTPIVFAAGTDPLSVGLVDSIRSPGGSATGVHFSAGDVTGKRVELLKEIVPQASRLITFYDPSNPSATESIKQGRQAAQQLRMTLVEKHVRTPGELQAAADALGSGEADGYVAVADAMVDSHSEILIAVAKRIKLPTIFYEESITRKGALASYGVDLHEVGRLASKYVHRLLTGGKVSELPVERVTSLSFVINLTAAQQIGLTIPTNVLSRADKLLD